MTIASNPLQIGNEERLRSIERRWPRHRWDGRGQSRWRWEWRHYLYIVVMALLFSTMILEMAVWTDGRDEPLSLFAMAETSTGLAVLLLLIALNGWLVDRNLADRTPAEMALPWWLACGRGLLACLPVAGLLMIPAWRWVLQARPSWATRTSPPLDLRWGSSPVFPVRFWRKVDRLRRIASQSLPGLLAWLVVCQIVPWLEIISWLTTGTPLEPVRKIALFALNILLHGTAYVLTARFERVRALQLHGDKWRAPLARYSLLLLFLPFPLSFLGLGLWLTSSGEGSRGGSLIERIHGQKGLPLRRALRSPRLPVSLSLQRVDPSAESNEDGRILSRRMIYYRLKTVLLFFDAGALAWILSRIFGLTVVTEMVLSFVVLPCLVVAGIGLVLELASLVRRGIGWLRRDLVPYSPFGRTLLSTQLALAAGALTGLSFSASNVGSAGLLLVLVGLGMILGSTLLLDGISDLLVLPGRQTAFQSLVSTMFFLGMTAVGGVMAKFPESAWPLLKLFKAALALTPAWSLALFVGFGRTLWHPLRLQHLLDHRLPGQVRAALAAVSLTAALPLGGIAIPFWIYSHRRLWPRFQRELWNLERSRKTRVA
jgi:hypothetical protein